MNSLETAVVEKINLTTQDSRIRGNNFDSYAQAILFCVFALLSLIYAHVIHIPITSKENHYPCYLACSFFLLL